MTANKKQKIREWLHRYVPSEIAAITTAYLGFWGVSMFTDNLPAAAYASAMSENIGFYGVILYRELKKNRKDMLKTCGGLLVEFGPGEILDSFVIRPLTIGLGTQYLGMELGVLVGKLSADVTFFLPTIAIYEFKKSLAARKAAARTESAA